jgi:hypothetical protein
MLFLLFFLINDYSSNFMGQDYESWVINVIKPHFKELRIWFNNVLFI